VQHSATCLHDNTDTRGVGRGEGEERGELRRRLLRKKQGNVPRKTRTRAGGDVAHRVGGFKWWITVQPAYTTTRIRGGGGGGGGEKKEGDRARRHRGGKGEGKEREANCADDCCGRSSATCDEEHGGVAIT